MRFVFLSGPECGDVASTVNFGLLFPVGVPVDVADPRIAAKLRGNRFFRLEGDELPATEAVVTPPRRGRPRKEG